MAAAGCLGLACTGRIGPVGGISDGESGSSGGDGGAASSTGTVGVTSTTTTPPTTTDTSVGGGSPGCGASPEDDADGDGFSEVEGDCDDCDASINPNALDLATVAGDEGSAPAPVDDDCDGTPDEVPEVCDKDIAVGTMDPLDAARAVDLCKVSSGPGDWGVVSAAWVRVDGAPPPEGAQQLANFHLGHGVLPTFGATIKPRAGARLLALSSGTARQPSDQEFESPEGFDKGYEGRFPQGFPKPPRDCMDVAPAGPSDPTAVEITLRVPSNVHGFSFDVNYITFDWPNACDNFNDFFIALLSPRPPDRIDGHILFDSHENAMSINNDFIDVCTCDGERPCDANDKKYWCPLGAGELLGTGYEGRAGTSWLRTTAPVEPNQEIKIRWGAYDAGDHQLDSTGLVDNWRWITDEDVPVATTPYQDRVKPEAE